MTNHAGRPSSETCSETCRLCDGTAFHKFDCLVLEKYHIGYFECASCGSLQTEFPHWLAEAYAIPGVHVDVGQAARVVQTWLRLCFLLQNIGFERSRKCVDYGGSAGLLTRLMRDSGYDYYSYDLYEGSKYANYFKVANLGASKLGLLSAFEVLEHLPQPKVTLAEMFTGNPDLLVFTTQFYQGQGNDWPYLVPFCGQHVFFYTSRALETFANSYGYDFKEAYGFWVLVRRQSPYMNAIRSAVEKSMDAAFAGDQVMRVGWGTETTTQDGAYAFDRFIRELKDLSERERSPLQQGACNESAKGHPLSR